MTLPAKFKCCKPSQLRRGSAKYKSNDCIHYRDIRDKWTCRMEIKNILLIKSYLNWKSCWQTNWAQKEAEEMQEELNLRCYFQRGPISLNSYTPQCIRDHVFLLDIQIAIITWTIMHFWRLKQYKYKCILTKTSQFEKEYRLQIEFSRTWLEQHGGYLLAVCIWGNQEK